MEYYYFDCDCEKEHFEEFNSLQVAFHHFLCMPCKNKILYDNDFKTIEEYNTDETT